MISAHVVGGVVQIAEKVESDRGVSEIKSYLERMVELLLLLFLFWVE
jgi:hypothetical protein